MDQSVPFEGVLGNTCELRLLQFLLPLDDMYFSASDLAEEVDANLTEVHEEVQKLVAWEVLFVSEEIPPKYTLNSKSPIVYGIEILNNGLISCILRKSR